MFEFQVASETSHSTRAHRSGAYFRHAVSASVLLVVLGIALLALQPNSSNLRDDFEKQSIVLSSFRGIDDETRGHIDSGEWLPEAIKLDQEKGLLPPDDEEEGTRNHLGLPNEDDDSLRRKAKAPKSQNSSTVTGKPANSSEGVSHAGGGDGASASGHCQKDVHISCATDLDCGPLGSCVQWHCSNETKKLCTSTDDCGTVGGICTGAGYCISHPDTACAKDEDCETYGGSCQLGGHCIKNPSIACIQDSDCGQTGDSCSFQIPEWWRVDTNFPQESDDDFGPYYKWTSSQLRKKLLLTMRKIIHMQHDLESQVPVNSRIRSSVDAVRAHLQGQSIKSIHDTQARMAEDIDAASSRFSEALGGPTLWGLIARANASIVTKDASQDERIAQSDDQLASLNATIASAFPIARSELDSFFADLNDTVVALNESQQNATREMRDGFNATLAAAEGGLRAALGRFVREPTDAYRAGEAEVVRMFADIRASTEKHLRAARAGSADARGSLAEQAAAQEALGAGLHNASVGLSDAVAGLAEEVAAQVAEVGMLEDNINATLVRVANATLGLTPQPPSAAAAAAAPAAAGLAAARTRAGGG